MTPDARIVLYEVTAYCLPVSKDESEYVTSCLGVITRHYTNVWLGAKPIQSDAIVGPTLVGKKSWGAKLKQKGFKKVTKFYTSRDYQHTFSQGQDIDPVTFVIAADKVVSMAKGA